MTVMRRPLVCSVWMIALLAGCGGPADIASLRQAVTDQPFWLNPFFPGSTPYRLADGHTWYDSDIGPGYPTGSYVRLPTDANYIADWSTPTYCVGGGTQYMWSPVFTATVNGVTTNFVFNHLSQSYLGAGGRQKGWYNGGALIGLTGGGTCVTGYPTHSTGPHFCNEMRDHDPYTFWKPLAYYTSNCANSNGTSGVANPICGGTVSTDPCRQIMPPNNGLYCGQSLPGGNANLLYDCQTGTTKSTAACACGCVPAPPGSPDACKPSCNDPCAGANGGNGPYCGSEFPGGNPGLLYNCQNKITAGTSDCKCGCTVMPPGTPDVCVPCTQPADLAQAVVDLGTDDSGGNDLSAGDLATLGQQPDLAIGSQGGSPDLATGGGSSHGGCSFGGRAPIPAFGSIWLGLLAVLLRRLRRRLQ